MWRVCSATLKGTMAGEKLGVWGNWCVEKGTTREGWKDVAGGLLTCCPECPRAPGVGLLCTVVQVRAAG